jgi:hypothetical protein
MGTVSNTGLDAPAMKSSLQSTEHQYFEHPKAEHGLTNLLGHEYETSLRREMLA